MAKKGVNGPDSGYSERGNCIFLCRSYNHGILTARSLQYQPVRTKGLLIARPTQQYPQRRALQEELDELQLDSAKS